MYIDGRWLTVACIIVIAWLILTTWLIQEWYRLSLKVADLSFLYLREQEKKLRVEETNAIHQETLAVISHDLIRDGYERNESGEQPG